MRSMLIRAALAFTCFFSGSYSQAASAPPSKIPYIEETLVQPVFWHGFATPVIDSTFTCFRSAASGTCGAATAHYFDATCNGIADDSPSLTAWKTYAFALNPALVKLYMPPGSICHFVGDAAFTWDGNVDGSSIKNALVVAYGASIDRVYFGGEQFFQDATHSALIATVGAGASSVTVTDGNIGRFATGDYIKITGVCLDGIGGGYPPTVQFYDSTTITNIVGNVISLARPTTYQYKSTWPSCTTPSGPVGPATVFKIPRSWNTYLQLYGLTIKNPVLAQTNIDLRQAEFYNVTVETNGTIAPSTVDSFYAQNSTFVDGIEVDKENGIIQLDNSTTGLLTIQVPSPKNLIINNSRVNCAINGTPLNITTLNMTIVAGGCDGRFAAGPYVAGHGNSVSVTGGLFPSAQMLSQEFLISDVTSYSSGTFTLAKTASGTAIGNFFSTFVPGFEYKFSYHNAFQNSCTPLTTFWGSDLREDASNYYFDTTTWVQAGAPISAPASLPVLTCGASPSLVPYPAQSITQTGTGASPSLTIFAPPQ